MPKKLEYGLQPPPTAVVAWGARAIFRMDRRTGDMMIDFVHDRQDAFGSEAAKQELFRWMDAVGMDALKERVQDLDPRSNETIKIVVEDYTIKASPKRSRGYLYIVAWGTGPKEWTPRRR